MPADPNCRTAELPRNRDLRDTLGNVDDVARLDGKAAERFLEDGRVRLVAPRLLGRDNQLECHPELPCCGGEQVVIDVRDDDEPEPACKGA